MKGIRIIFSAIISILTITSLSAQNGFPELSQKGTLEQNVGFTTVRVEYERPSTRGRKIFGELVPFDKLWRTGAGKCTRIRFSGEVRINGQRINAGAYSLFTIPGLDEWTVILNADTALYGYDNYDMKKDVIRFKTRSITSRQFFESLTIMVDVISNNAELYIAWEKTQVHFAIMTRTDEDVMRNIRENLLNGKSRDWNEYAAATRYYLYNNLDMKTALTLVDKAIQNHGELSSYTLKMKVLEQQQDYASAIKVANGGLQYIKDHGVELGYSQNESKSLQEEIERLKAKSRSK